MNFVDEIAEKVRQLPLEKQLEVRDFVDFLIERALRDARRLQSLSSASSMTPTPSVSSPPVQQPAVPVPNPAPEKVLVSDNTPLPPQTVQPPSPAQVLQSLSSTSNSAFSLLTEADKAAVGEQDIEEAVGEMENFWSSWDDS